MYEIQLHPADIRKQVRYYFLSRLGFRWLVSVGVLLTLVLVTGTVVLNKDFGAGYKYDVMIEGATITKE